MYGHGYPVCEATVFSLVWLLRRKAGGCGEKPGLNVVLKTVLSY